MKRAIGKKELLAIVPLSLSTIDRLEKEGAFPKRWYITDGRCAWNVEEVERWLDERQATSSAKFVGKKPPVELRVYASNSGGLAMESEGVGDPTEV